MQLARSYSSFWRSKNATVKNITHEHNPHGGAFYYPKLMSKISCDICIIGGGITGISLAYILARKGVDVVVLEGASIGSGATGSSSAHLDPLLEMGLGKMTERFGVKDAKAILNANLEALSFIEKCAKTHAPGCEFKKVKGSFLAYTDEQAQTLEKELKAALELGLNPQLFRSPEGPFNERSKCSARLDFNCHALFDPLIYIQEIAKAAKLNGARIFENSRALSLDSTIALVEGGQVKASQVVLATHMPIGMHPVTQGLLCPMRSYIIGIRAKGEFEDSLFWDLEKPYHYLRKAFDNKGEVILIGGADHRTGNKAGKKKLNPYEELLEFANKRFEVKSMDYAWSDQFYASADGLPYIGRLMGEENLWYASGFDGNGLVLGSLAAMILGESVLGEELSYAPFFSPQRLQKGSNLKASAKGFFEQNVESAKDFFMDRMARGEKSPADLLPEEGAIIKRNGKQLACYKHFNGDLCWLNPVCTHAKCIVRWNQTEKSWDCPCHGGRFSATGEVLNGPPTKNLEELEFDSDFDTNYDSNYDSNISSKFNLGEKEKPARREDEPPLS